MNGETVPTFVDAQNFIIGTVLLHVDCSPERGIVYPVSDLPTMNRDEVFMVVK